MASVRKQIVAMGGGSFSAEPEGSCLDAYVLALSGPPRPKICFLPTASGDAAVYIFTGMETRPKEMVPDPIACGGIAVATIPPPPYDPKVRGHRDR